MAKKANNPNRELTYKESLFVDEYIACQGNATAAYCRAYNCENNVTARKEASNKLKQDVIKTEIQKRTAPHRLSLKEEEQIVRKRLMDMIDGTDTTATNTDVIRAIDIINRMAARYINRTVDETNNDNTISNLENEQLMDIINKNPLQ